MDTTYNQATLSAASTTTMDDTYNQESVHSQWSTTMDDNAFDRESLCSESATTSDDDTYDQESIFSESTDTTDDYTNDEDIFFSDLTITTEEEDDWLNPDKYDMWGSPLSEEVLQQRQEAKSQRQNAWITKKQTQATKLLDTREKLNELLMKLGLSWGTEPQFVVDCEGFNRYRLECDVMEIYHIPEDILYLVDVWVLGKDVFDWTPPSYGLSLRKFLESPIYLKLMYDCRQDANALKMSYDISLQGIADMSLMATDLEGRSTKKARGWDHRISVEDAIDQYLYKKGTICEFEYQAMSDAKECRAKLPGFELFAQRPLHQALIDYTQDVRLMGVMYQKCFRKHYKGVNAFEWDIILDLSNQDASHAASDLFTRESDRGPETPWSDSRYFLDHFEDFPDTMAERASNFQAEIDARRAQGHIQRAWEDRIELSAESVDTSCTTQTAILGSNYVDERPEEVRTCVVEVVA